MATITVAQGAFNTGYTATQMPIIQNLGPGTLYLNTVSTNISTDGLQLPVGAVYEFPKVVQDGAGAVWIQAIGGDCDVRIINVG
jgi:hypothetical protein